MQEFPNTIKRHR